MTSPSLRFITTLLTVITAFVVIPLTVLSFYNHPSPADDYCFANTAMQYGFWRAQQFYYDGWSGRFFHNFIVHSSPLTVGWYGGYKVYPLVLLALVMIGFYALASQWLHRSFGKSVKIALAAGLFIGFITTLAGLAEFLYWYAGMACYSLSCAFYLLLITTLLSHSRQGFRLQIGYLVAEALLITGIIGSSETSMVMVMSLLAMIALGELIQRRRLSATMVILLIVSVVGCYFLITAPGNAIRMGSNANSSNIPLTLTSSLRYSIGYITRQLFATPLLPLSLLYLPVAYKLTEGPLPSYLRINPLLAALHGAATVLVLISLHFYGVGIAPVPRLVNLINLVFWLSWGYNLTLLTAVFRSQIRPTLWKSFPRPALIGIAVWIGITVWFGPVVGMVYDDLFNGRPQQYDRAMQQRYEQLSGVGDASATLTPLPVYPASLFLEDVKNDPQHLWNRCWADYYHKKTIVLKADSVRLTQ